MAQWRISLHNRLRIQLLSRRNGSRPQRGGQNLEAAASPGLQSLWVFECSLDCRQTGEPDMWDSVSRCQRQFSLADGACCNGCQTAAQHYGIADVVSS